MVTATKSTTLTLTELVDRFLTACRHASPRSGRRLSQNTLDYYETRLEGLKYFADRNDWPPPAELTRDHLRQFMYYLDTEPERWGGDGRRGTLKKAAPATVNHYLKSAKTLLRWALDEDYLPETPQLASLLRLRLPPPNYKDIEPYTDAEVGAMRAACERDIQRGNRYRGVRNQAIIAIFIDTGLRRSEVADMKLSELDPQLQQVRVLGKGAKLRVVPINGQARKALRLYLTQYRPPQADGKDDAVWLAEDGQPITDHGIRLMIDRLKRRAGVTSGGSAHRFRHYFATRYLENGGDINTLRLLLGHATLYMVLKYTKFVQVRRALDSHAAYSPLDRLARGGNHDYRQENWGWRGVKQIHQEGR